MDIEKEVEKAYKRCSNPEYMYNIVENEVKDFIARIIDRTGRGGVVIGNALDRLFKRIHYMNQCGFEKRYPIQYKYNRLDTLKEILKYINNGGSFSKELEKYLGAFQLSVVKEGLKDYKFKTEKTMKKKKVKLDDVRKYIDSKNVGYADSEVCEKFGISKQQLAGFKAALTKEKNRCCKVANDCKDDSEREKGKLDRLTKDYCNSLLDKLIQDTKKENNLIGLLNIKKTCEEPCYYGKLKDKFSKVSLIRVQNDNIVVVFS